MGACASHQPTHQPRTALPTPMTLTEGNVFQIFYPTEDNKKINFEEVYMILNDCAIVDIKKLHLVDEENMVTRDIVHVEGFHVKFPREQLAMIIEVVGSKVIIQIGVSDLLNLVLNSQRKFIVSRVRPPFNLCINTILQRILEISYIASTKEIMKIIRVLNK